MAVDSDKPRVLIIGGGFAGLHVAKGLRRAPCSVLLVDRQNYHLFQPLLYQVATAELDAGNIAAPIRKVLRRQKNARVALEEVTGIDLARSVVCGRAGELAYDYLVVASGAQQSYFGHDEFRPHAPGLKTIDDALELRRRVLLAFEEAEWEADEAERRAKLTFVIVGGGPTGVELSGAIMDVASRTLPQDFRNIDTRTAQVILVQGGDRLVPAMPEDLCRRVHSDLEKMGVEIRLKCHVTHVDEAGVYIGDEHIAAENVFWAAGVHGQTFAETLGVDLDRSGRIIVGSDLSVTGDPRVFAIGDAASAKDGATGEMLPGLAQVAIQSGNFVAGIVRDELNGKSSDNRPAFHYYDKGSMAIIGRGKAVAAVGKRHFGGLLGWLMWNLVHVMFLVGFGNKILVTARWMLNFIANTRRARLITGDPEVHIKRLQGSDEDQQSSAGKTDPELTAEGEA